MTERQTQETYGNLKTHLLSEPSHWEFPGKWICKTLQSLRTTHRWTASSLLQGVLSQCESLLQGAEQNTFSLPIGRYQKDVQLHLPKPPGVICPLRRGVIEGDRKMGSVTLMGVLPHVNSKSIKKVLP